MRWLGLAALVVSTGCGPNRKGPPGGAVDSVVPREIALAKFQAGSGPIEALGGGGESREALVRRFITAVERRDTAGLAAMTLSRSEFAYLYYPTTPQGLPPYELNPELLWFLTTGQGRQGLARVLGKLGGARIAYLGHECSPTPSVEGDNRLWGPCVVIARSAGGDTTRQRLFGLIIERAGQFKFVNLANKLD